MSPGGLRKGSPLSPGDRRVGFQFWPDGPRKGFQLSPSNPKEILDCCQRGHRKGITLPAVIEAGVV